MYNYLAIACKTNQPLFLWALAKLIIYSCLCCHWLDTKQEIIRAVLFYNASVIISKCMSVHVIILYV